jgi:hypothetical protein
VEDALLCRHEMQRAWCAFCLGQVVPQSASSEELIVSSPFPAKYKIRCDTCGEIIIPGEMVCLTRQHPDDLGDIIHEDCVDRGTI